MNSRFNSITNRKLIYRNIKNRDAFRRPGLPA